MVNNTCIVLETNLPNEYEKTCFPCGYNVTKRKNELIKIQLKKLNFINRINYAEKNITFVLMYTELGW